MARFRFGALVAAAAIVVTACGSAATATPAASQPAASQPAASQPAASETPAASATPATVTPKQGGTLVVGLEGDITRTDPSLVDDLNSTYVAEQVVETLVTLKPGTGSEIVPMLADSWTVSTDGLTYTFKLHPNVKFHDGTDFNAEAVKVNFDRWINIPDSYVDPGYTYYIDTVFGHGKDTKFASTAAPDPLTFVVTLKAPNSSFLIQLTLTPFGMQSPKALTDGHASDPDFKKNTYAVGGPGPAMVGTGAFMFKEWVPGDHATVVKNPSYWNAAAGGPYLNQVTFKPIGDTTARLNQIQSGGIDVAEVVAPQDLATVKSDPNLVPIDRGSACNAGVLGMNQAYKPFDNLKIREAVAAAIDRKALVDAYFAGAGVLLSDWAPPGFQYVKELALPAYDPEKAKSLIAESGVTDLSFDFWYPSGVTRAYMPDPKGEADTLLTQLEAVGLKPNPKTAQWGDYTDAWTAGKYPMFLAGWNCDWAGIDNFLVTAFFGYQNGKPNASYGYKNDAMNQAMVDALQASDPAAVQADWEKAQDMILADMPSVPLGATKSWGAIASYVKGFVGSPTILEFFTNVWLDK
jgi:peptide/nickel transport system substrate-binding protein